MKTAKILPLIALGLIALYFLPSVVVAGESITIKGKIVERTCLDEAAIKEIKNCPIDKTDPRINGENDYVLKSDDNTYYFLPNVPRDLKKSVGVETVVVSGKVFPQYQSLIVDKITEDDTLLWCRREMIYSDNTLYPVQIPGQCVQ